MRKRVHLHPFLLFYFFKRPVSANHYNKKYKTNPALNALELSAKTPII